MVAGRGVFLREGWCRVGCRLVVVVASTVETTALMIFVNVFPVYNSMQNSMPHILTWRGLAGVPRPTTDERRAAWRSPRGACGLAIANKSLPLFLPRPCHAGAKRLSLRFWETVTPPSPEFRARYRSGGRPLERSLGGEGVGSSVLHGRLCVGRQLLETNKQCGVESSE